MRAFLKALGAAALVLAGACTESPSTPSQESALLASEPGHRLMFLTRNMYVGADLDAVTAALLTSDPADDFPAMVNAAGVMKATDYDLRVVRIADEIKRTRPAVVGLQEVTSVYVNLKEYGVPININGDFMTDLEEQFAEQSLPYVVGAKIQNWTAAPLPGVNLVDYDVILVDPTQVTLGGSFARTFSHNVGPMFPGVNQVRGFAGVEITFEGFPMAVVTTHLESGEGYAHLRGEQAGELAQALAHRPRVVLMGDFNDVVGSRMYTRITEGGFRDAWAELGTEPGNTCCMLPDLSNERPRFTQRIDYVFARGFEFPERGLIGDVKLIGIERTDRFDGPEGKIWPSDHAGLLARLRIPMVHVDE
jgi:endonuclease/exonuclease/phosphatase family metal-dependent hydrolase